MDYALGQAGEQPFLVHIGFHQETAAQLDLYNVAGVYAGGAAGFLNRIVQVLTGWSNDPNVWPDLEFLTVEQAARRFLP